MWNHSIDFNLIYIIISACKDINKTFKVLLEFDIWKHQNNNEQKYKKKMNEFVNKRCCNHSVNLFSIFFSEKYKRYAVEDAAAYTVNDAIIYVVTVKQKAKKFYHIKKNKTKISTKQFLFIQFK
ncbi:hypothetical protein RFI_37641 [Reticulomyxa filosa]|uniref:Uncharacterized protein n=1 Tax=Reticulomyxa filosa TaxID=46433 RepID=X6LFC6_RETFI|nr:hypothetical protein RFI_37641 [Reticulomyxa filosa]|eukprot:ETN99826.1 hypothetical protein RFI_37641 [Reticulomyxa filosa]